MKNRTFLTLVISLLVCIMTAGAFAQTNPSALKPEEPAQAENVNSPCPYKVVSDDKVYLQIKNVKLRSDNLPLKPFFNVFGKNGDNWKKVSGTWSQAGNQICEKVEKPSNFQIFIDSAYQEYFINVYSDLYQGDKLVARGVSFKTAPLIQWAKDPQNVNKIYPNPLEISKGNTIKLKYVSSKNNRYYFEIVSYSITSLDKQFVKHIHDSFNKYKTKVFLNSREFSPEKIDIGSDSVPILSFNKDKSEVLLLCAPKFKYVFSIKNNQGEIDTIELSTSEIVKQLNECMQKRPDDYTQWIVKCISKKNSEIELIFAGFCIQTEDSDNNAQKNISAIDGNVKPALTVISTIPEETTPTEVPAESACLYKVTNNDKVYFQISKVNLRSDNLPLKPFFRVYGKNGTEWKKVSETSSQDGNQICNDVQKPSSFRFYIDKGYQDYKIDVHSKLFKDDNIAIAQGTPFNVEQLLKWTEHPYNRGRTYYLTISNGNLIGLKNVEINQGQYYYEIVSYKLTSVDDSYKKHFYESYDLWVETKQENAVVIKFNYDKDDKIFKPATPNASDHAELFLNNYDKNKRDFLLSCAADIKISFSFANDKGILDSIELSSDDIVKQLNDCMKRHPDNHSQWVVKCVSKQNSEIELCFNGIQRIYRVTTVSIPLGHSTRNLKDYEGKAPEIRVYIQQNGDPCGISSQYATTGRRSWDCDIPNNNKNRFQIREGISARFSLQIKDPVWFSEKALVDISGIKDLDFAKGEVYEKLDPRMDDDEKRTRIQFEEVKE